MGDYILFPVFEKSCLRWPAVVWIIQYCRMDITVPIYLGPLWPVSKADAPCECDFPEGILHSLSCRRDSQTLDHEVKRAYCKRLYLRDLRSPVHFVCRSIQCISAGLYEDTLGSPPRRTAIKRRVCYDTLRSKAGGSVLPGQRKYEHA